MYRCTLGYLYIKLLQLRFVGLTFFVGLRNGLDWTLMFELPIGPKYILITFLQHKLSETVPLPLLLLLVFP